MFADHTNLYEYKVLKTFFSLFNQELQKICLRQINSLLTVEKQNTIFLSYFLGW